MNRLTERSNIGWWLSELKDESGEYDDCPICCEKQHGCDCCHNCPIQKAIDKLAHYEDLEEQLMKSAKIDIDNMVGEFMHYYNLQKENRLIELPCAVGDELYRVTYPYRQPPKVTKYRVKNFRTIKQGQKLQLEVQADCVPAKNWMYFEDFCTTKEEAERKLMELEGDKE